MLSRILSEIRRLIYYPEKDSFASLQSIASERCLRPFYDNKRRCIGWKTSPNGPTPKNRLLVYHGNAGYALDRTYIVEAFQRLSGNLWEVLILEYPGYGARRGTPSEQSFKKAGLSAAKLLLTKNKRPLYLAGESIGSGVATYVAAQLPDVVSGLLLLTPFDTFANAARSVIREQLRIPVPLPIPFERYNNIRELEGYCGSLAVVLAEHDEVIPFALGERLYKKYRGPKQLWITNTGHNDYGNARARLWRQLSDFLLARRDS